MDAGISARPTHFWMTNGLDADRLADRKYIRKEVMCSQETTHSNNMNQKNNLVKNASFLMIAAMISKVIGLLYKSPLSNIIGSLGMGYTSLAQNAYMILLMIASFSIPQAVSKLISERIALKDYRNAHKFFKGAMIVCHGSGRSGRFVLSLRGRTDHSEESERCDPGTSDSCTDNLPVRYPGCIQRIFSGIQKYDAYIYFPDSGTGI